MQNIIKILSCLFLIAEIFCTNSFGYDYEFIGSNESINGWSYWDQALLKMSVSIDNNNKISAYVTKIDNSSFKDENTPYMYLQKDHYDYNYGNDKLSTVRVYSVKQVTLVSNSSLDQLSWPSDNMIKIYARYQNSGGGYAWVGPVTIKRIDYDPFPAPGLNSPNNNANNVSVSKQDFRWNSVSSNAGTPNYRLLLSTNYSFSGFTNSSDGGYCNSNQTCKTIVITNNYYSGFNLEYGTTYYWKVRAGNNNAGGSWSNIYSFTTQSPLTYSWKIDGNWGNCSVTCGDGYQYRNVLCIRDDTNEVVSDSYCNYSSKPSTKKECYIDCPECDSNHLYLCNSSNCALAGGHWYNNTCNSNPEPPKCDSNHLYLCHSSNCSIAGGHWYNNTCNANPEPPKCDSNHLYLCNSTNCGSAGGYWYNNTCNTEPEAPKCDSNHLSLCNSTTCPLAGGFWYNNSCNETEEYGSPIEILNNQPVSGRINVNQKIVYFIQVPDTATALIIETEDVIGDPIDLYVKKDQVPEINNYEVRSYSGKGNERIRIDSLASDGRNGDSGSVITSFPYSIEKGNYYIMLHSEKTGGDYKIKAVFFEFDFPFSEQNWYITCGYNCGFHENNKWQYSLDFAQSKCDSYGKPILAAEKGTILSVRDTGNEDFGRYVKIDHGYGYVSLYAHLSTISVKEGLTVQKGQEIGTCGNTGNSISENPSCDSHPATHLHFTLLKDDVGIKPEPLSGYFNFLRYQIYNGTTINNPSTFIIIDDSQAEKSGSDCQTKPEGYMGNINYVKGTGNNTPSVTMIWRPQLLETNNYIVYAHIADNRTGTSVKYLIHHANGDNEVTINQNNINNKWIRLSPESGYQFNKGNSGYVRLDNSVISADNNVIFDAILFTTPEWGIGGQSSESAPTNLTGFIVNSEHIFLEWHLNENSNPESYNIYRNNSLYDTVSSSITTYQDNNINQGVEYSYYVTAIYESKESESSNSVSLLILQNQQLPDDWMLFNASNYTYQMMITAELFDDNGNPLTTSSDYLGVFVKDECRGYVVPTEGPQGKLFYLQAWSNVSSNEIIYFKYYNAKDQTLITINHEPINFKSDQSIGSISSPYRIDLNSIVTQEIVLNKGWNWISFQVIPEDNNLSVSSILSSIDGSCNRMVSQNGFSEYSNGWFGLVNTIQHTSMYMLKMDTPATLVLKGYPVNIKDTQIMLNKNWNWISYLYPEALPINKALESLDENGERIVGQEGFSEFYQGWWGGLTELKPGKGYKLKMKSESILSYDLNNQKRNRKSSSPNYSKHKKLSWSYNPSNFEYQGTMTASINNSTSVGDSIAAFVENECRGIGDLVETSTGKRFFLQIWSNQPTGEIIGLKYFSSSDNQIYNINETFEFTSNMENGNIENPIILSIRSVDNQADINKDGVLNLEDVILMLQVLSGVRITN